MVSSNVFSQWNKPTSWLADSTMLEWVGQNPQMQIYFITQACGSKRQETALTRFFLPVKAGGCNCTSLVKVGENMKFQTFRAKFECRVILQIQLADIHTSF